MHKKLAADLTSLAHSILQLKDKEDVFVLKQKAYVIYEKLALLAYVEEYINSTPNATDTKEDLIKKVEEASKKADKKLEKEDVVEEPVHKKEVELTINDDEKEVEVKKETEIIEQPFDELESLFTKVSTSEEKVQNEVGERKTLDEELSDTISLDVAAGLFEKPTEKKSNNNQSHQNLQIGLNDRIAFVKHLFDGSQEDFNRVVSQINTLKTEKEAKKFINKMVKPDYNWVEKEDYEIRFLEIIERKFN